MQTTAVIRPALTLVNGRATTTSKQVAEHFGKRHDHVVRDIRNLLAELPADPLPNFGEGVYTLPETGDQQHTMYTLTRDGFTLLAMGFTGKRALQFKLAYIEAFNAMEAALLQPATAASDVPRMTAAEFSELLELKGMEIVPRGGAQPALPAYITQEQAGELCALLESRFEGATRAYAWSRFRNHFKLCAGKKGESAYRYLPFSRFAEACAYIAALPSKEAALPAPDPFTSMFMPPDGRYVVHIENGRAGRALAVPEDACVMNNEEFVKSVADPFLFRRDLLPALIHTAAKRLAA